ncbi:MAG: methyltransferase domain-containing protein, partial [Rhodospirillales bacterium]|nr:methyltransferase domain-containing protein [Rhodospirillales bacterium]
DLLAFLTAEPTESHDLVTAAAVLIHLRDLEPVFGQAARVLAADGVLAFTLFPAEGAAVVADGNLYYRHPPALVRAAAAKAGLTVELCREAVHEHQHGKPVTALLWLLRRTV